MFSVRNASLYFVLTCSYTKLKDVAKLNQFVKQSNSSSGAGPSSGGGLNFDVLTAINVCRSANYYDHALYLAWKHSQHALYLAIQVEDTGNLLAALEYIGSIKEASQVEQYLKQYGSKFMHAYPRETTALLTSLCTVWEAKPMQQTGAGASSSSAGDKASNLQSEITGALPTPPALVPAPSGSSSSSAPAPSPSPSPSRPANPAEFIHLFVEYEAELESFLSVFFQPEYQGLLSNLSSSSGGKDKSKDPQTIVCNTMLELYLRQFDAFERAREPKPSSSAAGGDEKSPSQANQHDNPFYSRLSSFLKSYFGKFDADHALVLCKQYKFEKGILALYEKMKIYHEIVQVNSSHVQKRHQCVHRALPSLTVTTLLCCLEYFSTTWSTLKSRNSLRPARSTARRFPTSGCKL
jgi:hypothetical protein